MKAEEEQRSRKNRVGIGKSEPADSGRRLHGEVLVAEAAIAEKVSAELSGRIDALEKTATSVTDVLTVE